MKRHDAYVPARRYAKVLFWTVCARISQPRVGLIVKPLLRNFSHSACGCSADAMAHFRRIDQPGGPCVRHLAAEPNRRLSVSSCVPRSWRPPGSEAAVFFSAGAARPWRSTMPDGSVRNRNRKTGDDRSCQSGDRLEVHPTHPAQGRGAARGTLAAGRHVGDLWAVTGSRGGRSARRARGRDHARRPDLVRQPLRHGPTAAGARGRDGVRTTNRWRWYPGLGCLTPTRAYAQMAGAARPTHMTAPPTPAGWLAGAVSQADAHGPTIAQLGHPRGTRTWPPSGLSHRPGRSCSPWGSSAPARR